MALCSSAINRSHSAPRGVSCQRAEAAGRPTTCCSPAKCPAMMVAISSLRGALRPRVDQVDDGLGSMLCLHGFSFLRIGIQWRRTPSGAFLRTGGGFGLASITGQRVTIPRAAGISPRSINASVDARSAWHRRSSSSSRRFAVSLQTVATSSETSTPTSTRKISTGSHRQVADVGRHLAVAPMRGGKSPLRDRGPRWRGHIEACVDRRLC
jgi:hypothetical protein